MYFRDVRCAIRKADCITQTTAIAWKWFCRLMKKGRDVVGIEEELRGPVFRQMPDLLARLDLIVDAGDALKVSDFKTSRTQWDEDQVTNSADQLLLYSELPHPWPGRRFDS